MYPFIAKENGSITVFVQTKTYTIDPSYPNYPAVKRCIKENLTDEILDYLTLSTSVQRWSKGQVSVVENNGVLELMFNHALVHSSLSKRILAMFSEGYDVTPLTLFMENVMRNPSEVSRNELYDFLEHCDLPITENGHFLAYKMVRSDYTDIYSGTFSNRVGDAPFMPRDAVDPDRERTCSTGLHVCSLEYLKNGHYGSSDRGHRVMVVDVDPADVVSFPRDYNFSKGRVWTYTVVGELDWNETIPKNFSKNYTNNDDVWDERGSESETETENVNIPTGFLTSDLWAILDILALKDHPSLKKIGHMYGISARQVARIRDGDGRWGDPSTKSGEIWQTWHEHNIM